MSTIDIRSFLSALEAYQEKLREEAKKVHAQRMATEEAKTVYWKLYKEQA